MSTSTVAKFVVSFTKIHLENTLFTCNSKNAVIHFTRLFRPWVVLARAVSARVILIFGTFWPDRGRGKQQLMSLMLVFCLFQRQKRVSM